MARSMTMKARPSPSPVPPARWTVGVGNPWAADLGLDGGLLGGDAWVRHHPRHEVALPTVRCAPQAERHELGPEPAGQAARGTVEGQRRGRGRGAEHLEQVVFQASAGSGRQIIHGVYRNGICCYCRAMDAPATTAPPATESS